MLEKLTEYGPMGIILAALLTLFFWAFKRLFEKFLSQFDTFKSFTEANTKSMQENTHALRELAEDVRDQHSSVMQRLENLKRI